MNFSNGIIEIQQKYEREREKVGERKFWISIIWLPKFLLPKPFAMLKKETNCGNAITEIGEGKKNFVVIVAMPLPKMGWKKINK